MGMGRTNQRFQQGGPVTAPRWSPAQQEAWRGRQAAPPPDISLPRWGAPQAPPVGIPPMGPPAKPWQPPAGGLQPLPGLQPIYGSPPPDISLPRWGAPQPPPVGIPPMGPPMPPWQQPAPWQPPAGGMPPMGQPLPPMGQPTQWPSHVSGREAPGATRDWRGQQWTMGGAGPNQWTDRLGRGWGRNDGGLTSLYWPGGRVY